MSMNSIFSVLKRLRERESRNPDADKLRERDKKAEGVEGGEEELRAKVRNADCVEQSILCTTRVPELLPTAR